MPIAAQCGSCQKRFKAPDKLAGKKVKCPQCGGVIAIPVPQPPKEDAGDRSGLAEPPQAPAPTPAKPKSEPEPARTCPSCSAALVENAVLCVVCGYDLRSGQKLQTEHAAEAPAAGPQVTLKRKDWKKEEEQQEKKAKKKKKRKRERSETPQAIAFLRGCAVAFGTGMIGVGIWCALSWFTWGGWGIVAILVGGMVGTGMMIGYGHEDALPGIASAVIAFVCIIIAKVLVAVVVFMSIAGGLDEFADDLPEEEWAMEEGVDEEEFPDDEMIGEEAAEEGALEDGAVVDQQTSDAATTEVASDEESLGEIPAADLYVEDQYGDAETEEPIGGWFTVVVANLFMSGLLWDLLWMAIGCAMAYKVGSGGQWWED